jgi:hypothetical protein
MGKAKENPQSVNDNSGYEFVFGADGVLTSKGDTVLAVVYEDIRLMDKEFLVMTINQEVQYLYLPEKRIIQPIEQP